VVSATPSLNTTYGLVAEWDPGCSYGSACFHLLVQAWKRAQGGNASNSMLAVAVLVCSAAIAGSLQVSDTLISLTYALRIGYVPSH